MSKISSLFLFVTFLIFFSFLIFSTFFVTPHKDIKKIFSLDFKSGVFALSLSDNDSLLVEKDIETSILEKNPIFVDRFNYLDNLYFNTKDSYEVSQSNSNLIELKKRGIFLFDINNLNKKYKISYDGFILEPLSIGKFYIDTSVSKKTTIFSIDSVFKLSFKLLRKNEILTESYFFPHEFINFNPLKNLSLKNADFLRVNTVFHSGYIKDSFFANSSIPDTISKLISETGISFLNLVFKEIKNRQENNVDDYDKLEKIFLQSFPSKKITKKYIDFFYNDSKKAIYYKNNILFFVDKLFRSSSYEKGAIKDLVSYLKDLKNLDNTQYDDIINTISYYDKVISLSVDNKSIEPKLNFFYLKQELENKKFQKYINKPLINIRSFYSLFDMGGKLNNSNEFTYFVDDFLYSLSVITDKGEINTSSLTNHLFLDYFVYFLKNLLLSYLTSDSQFEQDHKIFNLDFINKYMGLSDFVYFNKSKLREKTGLYENLQFSKRLSKFIRFNFFEKDRNNEYLLIPKNNDILGNKNSLKFLEKNIQKLTKRFLENKDLVLHNKKYLNDYKKIKNEFPEYFLALFSYDEYSLKYDKIKGNLIDLGTINELEKNLTKKNFIDYISNFNGVDTSNIKLRIINNYYFSVKDLFINGLVFSFSLYPNDGNTIKDIKISGEGIIDSKKRIKISRNSYNLNLIKDSLQEKFSQYELKENKQDFNNFFLDTFFPKNKDKFDDISNETKSEVLEEDKIIVVFKNNKLLGQEGEFASIKDFLNIKYQNIKVKRDSENYSIYLDKIFFSIDLDSFGDFSGDFSSNYILVGKKHDFENIKLSIYDNYKKNNGKKFLLGANFLNIIGVIPISKLKEELSYILNNNFENMLDVYNKLIARFSNNKVNIDYTISTEKIKFILDYKNEDLVVVLSGEKIEYVSFSGKKIDSNLDLNKLDSVLKSIK